MLEFKDILGHEQIKEHFQNAAATGSYLILYSEINGRGDVVQQITFHCKTLRRSRSGQKRNK